MNIEKRVLAIDYGETRIGIAVSDKYNRLSIPLRIIRNTTLPEIISNFKILIHEYDISTLIVGLPLDRDGEETLMSAKIRRIFNEIDSLLKTDELDIDIIFWDESYTSKLSLISLKEKGKNAKKAKSLVDMESAAMILQEYLDNK